MAVALSEAREPGLDRRTDFERGVYGEKTIARLPLHNLITLRQVRDAKNRAAAELKSTIAHRLINQVDVARMTEEAFLDYAGFIDEIYGVENDLSSAMPLDGYYYVVMAGHTRIDTIRELEEERPTDMPTEYLEGPMVDCKVYDAMTPRDIISLQIDENIYGAPPQERKALAIVETYLYGLRHEIWRNKAEFLRIDGHKFGRKVLNDALHFIELPAEIRDFVLEGGVPYIAGVELGKTIQYRADRDLAKYFGGKPPESLNEEERTEFSQGMMDWLGYETAKLQEVDEKGRRKLRSTAVIRGRYESLRNHFAAELPSDTIDGQPAQQTLETMVDPMAEYKLERRRLREQHAALVRRLASGPIDTAATLIELHARLLGRDSEALSGLPDSLQREYIQRVGRKLLEIGPGEAETPLHLA